MPALLINFLVTALVYVGIKESKTASNMMVMLKLVVVVGVIAVGAFYVQPANWSPFAPNGATGVLKGIAAVFFAYIGFDAISTTAEECKNPQRDLPRATILTLIICTILYIVIALVLTGMVSYTELRVSDPLAFVFAKYNLNWMAGIVALSAIVAITSVSWYSKSDSRAFGWPWLAMVCCPRDSPVFIPVTRRQPSRRSSPVS